MLCSFTRISNECLLSAKAAAIIALFATGGYRRRRRSTSEDLASPEDLLLLAAVSRLDTHGCVLRLLCHLKAESPDALSAEERILTEAFAEHLDLFVKENGIEDTKDSHGDTCDDSSDECPFGEDLLRTLLHRVGEAIPLKGLSSR